MPEQVIQLQTDQITNIPGGGVRTITANVPVGQSDVASPLAQVQQQVVSIADKTGAILDGLQTNGDHIFQIMLELRAIRTILAQAYGLPAIFEPLPGVNVETPAY